MAISLDDLACSKDQRSQELATVASIYPDELTILTPTSATVAVPVCPIEPLQVRFALDTLPLSHLPPITLKFELPEGYPEEAPPEIAITAEFNWLPEDRIETLKREIQGLWEDFGRNQIVYTAIDHIQQCAERGFDYSATAPLALDADKEDTLQSFDLRTKKEVFERGSYGCGICLEPKKGNQCHAIRSCTHIFCRLCLVDYYKNLITEGDVSSVRCIDTTCVKKALQTTAAPRRKKVAELPQTLPPEELSEIGLSTDLVGRYVFLKKKKALEVDPNTLYCPRQWCQGPTRASVKSLEKAMESANSGYYLPDRAISLLSSPPLKIEEEEEKEGEEGEESHEKLQQCATCNYAFCRVCKKSWHGTYQICRASDAELTEEERQNEEYLRNHTTPCPSCFSATLKSHGCNHMICACGTHFCFLCSAYLPPENPFSHFNSKGGQCYQRLWEGEEGDEENIQLVHNRGRQIEVPGENEGPAAAPAPVLRGQEDVIDMLQDIVINFEEDDSETEWEVDFADVPDEQAQEVRPFAHRPPRGRRQGLRAVAWRRR